MQRFYQNKTLESYASRAVFPISLRQLIFFGKLAKGPEGAQRLIKSANFVSSPDFCEEGGGHERVLCS